MLEPVTLDLGKVKLTFAETFFWDWIAARRELRDAAGNVDGFELGLSMAWRSALAGGFKGSFQEFCQTIPSRWLKRVLETSNPFVNASEDPEASTPVTPSTSSAPAAP